MKNKIYVKCFLSKNLGDDLFLRILCDRYDEKFYLYSALDYSIISQNLVIKKLGFIQRLFRKIFHILNLDSYFEFLLSKSSDIIVVIGGSLFIENDFNEFNLYKLFSKNKKYFIIGSNIGPYNNMEFVDKIKKNIFFKAEDVCLRDKNSYQLSCELDNVRYAPDIVYSYDFSRYSHIQETNKVFISIINPHFKEKQMKTIRYNDYQKLIINIINYFNKLNFKIVLGSFCKSEGDELFIDDILTKITNKNNISTCFYNGDIDSVISEIASSKIIIGSRFHANVLGFALNKVVIPISYNNKTKNMLNDIGYNNDYIDLDNLENFKGIDSIDLTYKLDISELSKLSILHFERLDKVLKRKIDNE